MSPTGKVKRRMLDRKNDWEGAVVENINVLHDSTDDLESKFDLLAMAYAGLEKDFSTLNNSYRELKLKIK
jgi:hypothetical protein